MRKPSPLPSPRGRGSIDAVAVHEAFDAHERLGELLVGRGVAHAHVPCAAGAEGAPRHAGYLFLVEQLLGELVAGEAGRTDGREGVERALRPGAGEANAVEPL